jgi:Transglycosylase SLT domain
MAKLFLIDQVKRSNLIAFENKVNEIAARLGILPEWLMIAMHFESKLDPSKKNPGSSATGLIQFMSATAKNLGTTVEALQNMPGEAQLNYVYAYLKPYAGRIKSLGDLYLAIFYPSALGRGPDYILPLSTNTVRLNKVLDSNADDKLSAGEITAVIYRYFTALKKKYNYIQENILPALILGTLIYWYI